MTRTRTFLLSSLLPILPALLLTGCPTRPDDGGEVVGTKTPPSTNDAGTDTGAPKGPTPTADGSTNTGSTNVGLPSLRISSPASNVSANGTLAITVEVDSGVAPATIQLLIDGATLTTLSAPAPYHYAWDTTAIADGQHVVLAQATVNGQVVSSPPINVLTDRTAPTITSTTPASGATNVVLRAPITVKFSEPIAASSFGGSSISLLAGGAIVTTTATLAADGLSALVTIGSSSSLALPATFTATLAPTITDLAGNQIKASAWTWNVPDWIKYAPVASSTPPALAVGPNFQPTLAYTRCITPAGGSSCLNDLFVAASDGQAWNSLGQVPELTGAGSLDLDSQGRPIAAGVGVVGSSTLPSILLATWNGSTWDNSIAPIVALSNPTLPIVRLDPAGHPFVVWTDGIANVDLDVEVARWTGTAWDRSFGKFGLSKADSASLIFAANGNPIVGFSQGGGSILNAVTTSSFRAWNGTAWISATANLGLASSVALDTAAEPMMLASNTVEHYASGTWLPAVASPIPYSAAGGDSVLTTGPDHQPVVAWLDITAPFHVGLARFNGTAWNSRAGIFNAGGVVANQPPGVLVDGRGSVWVFWSEGTNANVWMSNY